MHAYIVIAILFCVAIFLVVRLNVIYRELNNTESELQKYRQTSVTKEYFLEYQHQCQAKFEKYKCEITDLMERLAPLEKYESCKQDDLKVLLSGQKQAFPYLANLIPDYLLVDLQRLEIMTSHGTYYQRKKQSVNIAEIRKQAKELLSEAKHAEYQLKYLLDCFPALNDFLDSEDACIEKFDYSDADPVRHYISNDEYQTLSASSRNQLALDRYIASHHKSKWQIGRDYELSVGYRYEQKGYKVTYFGEFNGLSDLGRDLIAVRNDTVLIIQCKYWSAEKDIHEKHIAQLYGTTMCFAIDNPKYRTVVPLFITSTNLSPQAKSFAEKLNVAYVENYPFKEFPRIKCNIGVDESGFQTRIYHLPMDQQYDTVKIDSPGEFLAFTVKEAEDQGFRRAYRWHAI